MSDISKADRKEIKEAFDSGELRVKAVDPDTKEVVIREVSGVLRHVTPDKNITKVTLLDGRSVRCTEDHSLFVLEPNQIVPVEASDLKAGTSIATVEGGFVEPALVVSVQTHSPCKYTYDLSVPGPENFVLENGILAHNSYSIGGVSLGIEKSSKYENIQSKTEQKFDKMLENKSRTVKIMRGLRQSRYGMGVRSAFGPMTGDSVLTPRKFMGI